jgi:hypothetical protein
MNSAMVVSASASVNGYFSSIPFNCRIEVLAPPCTSYSSSSTGSSSSITSSSSALSDSSPSFVALLG